MNKEVSDLVKRMRGCFEYYEDINRLAHIIYKDYPKRFEELKEICDIYGEFEEELLEASQEKKTGFGVAPEEKVIFDTAQLMWRMGLLRWEAVIAYIDAVPSWDYVEEDMWNYVADRYDIPIPEEDFDPAAFLEAAKRAAGIAGEAAYIQMKEGIKK